MRTDRLEAAPHHFSRRAEKVEVRRLVGQVAGGEDFRFEHRRGNRRAGELLDRREERIETGPGPAHALPLHEEPRERGSVDGLDLLAELRERAPLQCLQNSGVAPLAGSPSREELPFDDPFFLREPLENRPDRRDREAEPRGDVLGAERTVRPRPAGHEIAQRILDVFQERVGQARRRRDAERVAQPRGVLGRGESSLSSDRHPDDAPFGDQPRQPAVNRVRRSGPHPDLLLGQISEREEEVVEGVGVSDRAPLEPLEAALELLDRTRVEKLAQLRFSEKLLQLRLVDRQRLRPPFGQR